MGEPGGESLRDKVVRACAGSAGRGPGQLRVLGNLAAVVERGAAEDFRRLARLVAEQEPERLAAIQREIDDCLRSPAGLPVTTAAVRAMSDRDRVVALLVAEGDDPDDAATLAEAIERQAWYLLVAGIDPSAATTVSAVPPLVIGTAESFDAARWRVLLAPLLTAPWSGRADQLQREVTASGDPWLARLLEGCSAVIRDLQAEWDRQAIAREIRRLVASSGVTQRDFSALVGTSQSRFSTYINGRVTPSATMMLRISRTARTLRKRAAEESEVRSAS